MMRIMPVNIRETRRIIPSLFTLGNLLCGYLAVINVIEGALTHAAWWIIIAGFFDLLDGKIARLAGAVSEFGVEFDSIADVISFGIAPAVLIHQYSLVGAGNLGYFLGFVFVSAGAIRLARFNLTATTGRKTHFTGMPIPAAAGVLSSYILFCEHVRGDLATFDMAVALVILTSIAMVSQFRYAVMPHIGFNSPRETMVSTMVLLVLVSVVKYPDEIFFPMGIAYLFSGPVISLTAPAFNFVTHRGHHRW